MDTKNVNNSNDNIEQNNSQQNAAIEKLKFEVAQEMGIKPKAKNKKN